MRKVREGVPGRHRVRAASMRAGCMVLLVCLGSCGGGPDGAATDSTPYPAPSPAVPLGPAPLVVGTAVSIDDGAFGNPVSLRVARAVNGDGFAVWRALDNAGSKLWANHYDAAKSTWGTPVFISNFAGGFGVEKFDLTVEPSGTATVVWTETGAGSAREMSVRFDVATDAWTAPVLITNQQGNPTPYVTSDATGSVLAMDGYFGRFFDPISGTWREQEQIPVGIISSGDIFGPVPLLDGSGNALAVYHYATIAFDSLASNYFSSSTGSWDPFPPGFEDGIVRPVPGSLVFGFINKLQLANAAGGNFLAAWEVTLDNGGANPESFEIRVARFTSSTRTWSAAQTLVPVNAQNDVRFQRIGTDASGNALLLWTASDGTRTALKAFRLDRDDFSCGPVHIVDLALGGGAGQADLGVDPHGNAIAIWQQYESAHPNDVSRINIAIARFDRATGSWTPAVLAETQPGNATSPSASANGGQALLGWIQSEGGTHRVKALLQPLSNPPTQ